MSVRTSSKEILAKLMATENLFVEHANVKTAAFDLINRKLYLPNWKDISDTVYTLLISHEVGHALYTPRDEWESVVMKENTSKHLKNVINIVEDVRIEKLIQQKFPGTVRSFKAGYNELEKANLFGTVEQDISNYNLLDRLNIHFKIGHLGYANVPFADNEQVWLNKISACRSFQDVVSVATDLLQFVKDNPESQGKSPEYSEMKSAGAEPGGEQGFSKPLDEKEDGDDDGQGASDTDVEAESQSTVEKNNQQSMASKANNFDPLSVQTQEHFDRSIQNLVDESISKVTYANLPNIDLKNFIVPYPKVHSQIADYYIRYYPNVFQDCEEKVAAFKNSSKNVVNQLANLFEMKKKARLDERALTSRTGVLDTNRVYSYRYSDDLFKKITNIPVGKSHGLVMFIDMSSSMLQSIASTFEQLLNLVLFCRRVNIPFQVYGFTDAYAARDGIGVAPVFNPGDLCFEKNFCLREFFNNRMSGVEFNNALRNILCLMTSYNRQMSYMGVPSQYVLNCTPLNSTIITAVNVVNDFRAKNGLDIVNTIFLTDGDDTHGLVQIDPISRAEVVIDNQRGFGYFDRASNSKCFVRDSKSRKQWEINKPTEDLLKMFKELTNSKVIGFFLTGKSDADYRIDKSVSNYKQREALSDNFKKLKFAELLNVAGYDAYYMIPHGKSLKITEGEFDKDFDVSIDWEDQKQVKKAIKTVQKDFTNHMKERVVSRVLLNRFIDHIS